MQVPQVTESCVRVVVHAVYMLRAKRIVVQLRMRVAGWVGGCRALQLQCIQAFVQT